MTTIPSLLRNHVGGAAAVAVVAVMASIGVTAATSGSGAVGTVLARGTLEAGAKINTDELKFKTLDSIDVVTQSITVAPGGHAGWHSHPGPVFVTVRSGTLTFYEADDPTCSPAT